MKIIKSILIAACIVSSVTAFSQEATNKKDPKVTEMRAQKACDKWTSDLNLNDVQKKAAFQIFLEKAKQGDKDKEVCKNDATCLKEKKQERNKVAEKKLEAILSKEQYIQFQQSKKKALHEEVMQKESGQPSNGEAVETF